MRDENVRKGIGIEETKFKCGADCRRTSNFIERCENDFRREVIPCMREQFYNDFIQI